MPPPSRVSARAGRSLWLFLCGLGALGCGGPSGPAVPLILLSPHRDEIRYEVALTFPDWFRARSQERLRQATSVLATWLTAPGDEPRQRAEAAYDRFFDDWRDDDFPRLRDAYRTWKTE